MENRPAKKKSALSVVWLFGVIALFVCCAERLAQPSPAQPAPIAVAQAQPRPPGPTGTAKAKPEVDAPAAPSGGSSATVLVRGQMLFAKQCVICHGENGDGQGKFAYLMNPRPRDFRKGKFKLTTTQNLIPTDDDLLRTISRGMPGSAMPPWDHLPLADLKAIVAFVKSMYSEAVVAEIEKGVADGTFTREEAPQVIAQRITPGAPINIPAEPAFDDLRWFSGRRVYLEACASCHGVDGQPVAEAVKFDEEGFPDPPRSFVSGIFKGGTDGPQLFARISKGMRGTPMPAYEGIYTNDEMWDLIHYVQSLARAGSQERAQMRQGTIVAPNVSASLPSGPKDSAWSQARPHYVAMTPLWWTENRIEGLVVQALHNQDELAMRISWIDPTQDDRAVKTEEFRDGLAIQFSLSSDPPFYMGDMTKHGGVNIWMWKADRGKNIESGYQDVDAAFPDAAIDMYPECPIRSKDMSNVDWSHGKITEHNPTYITAWGAGNLVADPNINTPVECLVARGPGTLAGKPVEMQLVQGKAIYERGVWMVQLQRKLEIPCEHSEDERVFKPGDYLPISFAVWNGSAGDRDGKKNLSIWQKLVIE